MKATKTQKMKCYLQHKKKLEVKLSRRRANSITPSEINVPISQTS